MPMTHAMTMPLTPHTPNADLANTRLAWQPFYGTLEVEQRMHALSSLDLSSLYLRA